MARRLAGLGCVSVGAALPLAVARAGGHAMYPALFLPPAALEPVLDELASSTRAFGVNFIVPLHRCDRGDAFYAGQSAGAVHAIQPAAEIVEDLASGVR